MRYPLGHICYPLGYLLDNLVPITDLSIGLVAHFVALANPFGRLGYPLGHHWDNLGPLVDLSGMLGVHLVTLKYPLCHVGYYRRIVFSMSSLGQPSTTSWPVHRASAKLSGPGISPREPYPLGHICYNIVVLVDLCTGLALLLAELVYPIAHLGDKLLPLGHYVS